MAKKLSGWKTRGMNRDLSVSAFNPEFAFENMNLRLATNDGNTTMSWVNEKGTSSVPLFRRYWTKNSETTYIDPKDQSWEYHEAAFDLVGTCIGTAVLNHYLVLFITNGISPYADHIYRLEYNSDKSQLYINELFYGNINFSVANPLETLVSYESEHIQKVYWTDGINQPRLINIAPDNDAKINDYTNTSFDFITTLALNETIKVKKVLGGGGMFAPGVIQYAFTYYNKYGQESNIFYTTPLYYISHQDRGGSPEDKIDNAFKISITGVDTNFDYLRIYSIQRTSINGTPMCKRVQDIAIADLAETEPESGIYIASYIDTGTNGDSIDPTELLYKGGNVIHVGTMEQKDNTLFMGDIITPHNEKPDIKPGEGEPGISLVVGERKFYPQMVSGENYEYASQLTSLKAEWNPTSSEYEPTDESVPCAGFKYGDFYRCGIQFQDATGKWSDPVFIDDKEIETAAGGEDVHPNIVSNVQDEDNYNMTINVVVFNDSLNAITIRPEASIVIQIEASAEIETRNVEVEEHSNPDKAQILTVILGDFTSQTIAAGETEIFDSAIVRYGTLYYGKSFCTDTDLLAVVGMTVNCGLEDGEGNPDTLTMNNVTWDGTGTPALPSYGPQSHTYTFTCTASPVPPTPPGPGPEPPSGDLGEFLYKVALVSDLHLCATNDEETPSKTSDDWHDEDDFRAVMNVVLGDTDIKFVAGCGDAIESEAPFIGTPEEDSDLFWDIYSNSYWQNGIRLFTCLGNHDFYGMYESRAGDTITGGSNYLSLDGYNSSVKSRIGSIWYDGSQKGIQGYGVNGVHPNSRMTFDMEGTPSAQYDIHYFAFNSFTETYYDEYSQGGLIPPPGDPILPETLQAATAYINANWSTLKNKIGGWDQGSDGMRSGYSKESYWIKKNDDIYVFMSVDYGNDVWGLDSTYHSRMIRARTIIDVTSSDIYIKRMMEYVNDSGYTVNDEPYNYQYYSPNALIWLKELIEDNPDKKIYVFSHHFLPHRVGNGDVAVDGLPKNGAASYAVIHPDGDTSGGMNEGSNVLTGVEFWFLNKLINMHQNVIWFTGHSHLSWECKDTVISEENRIIDHISNRDFDVVTPLSGSSYVYTRDSNTPKQGYGGWCVALPSMSKPIVMDRTYSDGYIQKNGDAEMAIMYVYENGVIIKGYKVRENNVDVFNENNPLVEQTIILRSSASNSSESQVLLRSAVTLSEPAGEVTRDLPPVTTVEDIMVTVPVIRGNIPADIAENLMGQGYKKARAVVVYPDMQSRKVICQGVGCPTLYTTNHREKNSAESMGDMWAQSSWFFRPKNKSSYQYFEDTNTPSSGTSSDPNANIEYMIRDGNPEHIKRVEVQGHYEVNNRFTVDWTTLTFHSPDIEFDDSLANLDYTSSVLKYSNVGNANFLRTFSDIDIQTETPTISSKGSGFIKKSFIRNGARGIISGLFWDDYEVDDWIREQQSPFTAFHWQKAPMKWLVYLWNRTGSLNNDIERPADSGVASAVLKRKIVSNLRFANTNWITVDQNQKSYKSSLFYSDQPEILKLNIDNPAKANVYMGNVDTMLTSDAIDGMYFALSANAQDYRLSYDSPTFNSKVQWVTYEDSDSNHGNRIYVDGTWHTGGSLDIYKFMTSIGETYSDIVLKKCSVRMKYKSTPHTVMLQSGDGSIYDSVEDDSLPIFELQRNIQITDPTLFGGTSDDAMKALMWIPCGEPVRLDNLVNIAGEGEDPEYVVPFEYSWGDTYYQRWDCLKTYAFTPEDINQVVEIGSFMLETRVNIDGRYDRNRGQLSNLYMSPRNFNLLNPVYSQQNNFFTYRIQDEDAYNEKKYPTQITWSKTKTSGADVDLWTNVTLASVLEMDGDKGKVRKLARLNNNLICFQDKGIAQILYNDRVQINTQDGVPIEISNSDKVQGKNYITDSIGCSNKWSMAQTPSGIYFMDSINKAIFMFNGQLNNLSGSLGFNTWAKQNIPSSDAEWNPLFPLYNGKSAFKASYDKQNQDVLFINNETALAYSEKLQAFTSFYDYGDSPFFCNLDDTGIWIKNGSETSGTPPVTTYNVFAWKHQAGNYCSFFGTNKPYWMTLVGNPEPQADKIFTNIEFRACVEGDGELDQETGKFTPALPFDSLESWNEYQHGSTNLKNLSGHAAFMHHTGDDSSLKRKFRIWRSDIPRNNYELQTYPVRAEGETDAHYQERIDAYNEWLSNETEKGIYRQIRKPQDRMRNPWLYLKLMKNVPQSGTLPMAEIHDIVMTYFD